MALHHAALGQRARFEDVVRVLVVVAAVIVGMLALNVIFGFSGTGPWTDLTTDPGADLGLPF